MLKGNAIIAQSGGPSAVINNSTCGVIQTWFEKVDFGTIYAGISGIKGILEEDIIDLAAQDKQEIAATPTGFQDRPRAEQKIKSITLVDEGEVKEPEKC